LKWLVTLTTVLRYRAACDGSATSYSIGKEIEVHIFTTLQSLQSYIIGTLWMCVNVRVKNYWSNRKCQTVSLYLLS